MDVKVIRSSDIKRCPKTSMLPAHYRDDGSCRCDEADAARSAVADAERAASDAQAVLAAARERLRYS